MNRVLLMRADANAAIGSGHIMRCLALAQAWQRAGGRAVFAHVALTSSLATRIREEGFELLSLRADIGTAEDAQQTILHAQSSGAEWVVADGYGFGDGWQRLVTSAGLRLFICDDHQSASHRHAELVWNQNPAANAADYASCGEATQLLLGSRYAMLRREFDSWRGWRREHATVARKVLVTLGGGDPENVTLEVILALRMLPDVEAVIVVGASNPNLDTLAAATTGAPHLRLVVNATNMPELMAWAEAAFSAGGSTCWELAFMGLPAVVTVLADNQASIATELDRRGACISLGAHRSLTRERISEAIGGLLRDVARRREMSRRGRQLVDGHGAARVAAVLGARLTVTLVSDAGSWLNAFLPELKAALELAGHNVRWVHEPAAIAPGDIAFFLSLSQIVAPDALQRNAHNLVVHESALPHGRGWSPLTWQVLEGKNEIPISLIEAGESVDSGRIYAQDVIYLRGDELVSELRAAQAAATIALCRDFVARYPHSGDAGRAQHGEPSYYPRRRAADSQLDPDKTLREQFNLLRVADPDRYPAFFELAGRRYEIRLSAATEAARPAHAAERRASMPALMTQ